MASAATATSPAAADVVREIRRSILSGDYAPGQRLVEADLAAELGASRGSVRAALIDLSHEGLVERIANRGARVRSVSVAEALEITEVRMVVEGLCAAKAAERLTARDVTRLRRLGADMQKAVASGDVLGYSELNQRLHESIRDLSGQSVAAEVLSRLRARSVRHQFRLALRPGRPQVSLPQHLAIIDALCDRAPARAQRAMQRHIASVLEAIAATRTDEGRSAR